MDAGHREIVPEVIRRALQRDLLELVYHLILLEGVLDRMVQQELLSVVLPGRTTLGHLDDLQGVEDCRRPGRGHEVFVNTGAPAAWHSVLVGRHEDELLALVRVRLLLAYLSKASLPSD